VNTWEHYRTLSKYFYLDGIEVKPWIHKPFLSDKKCIEDVDPAKDELIDLRTKNLLQLAYNSKTLENFGAP
jgi:hypothetical protein